MLKMIYSLTRVIIDRVLRHSKSISTLHRMMSVEQAMEKLQVDSASKKAGKGKQADGECPLELDPPPAYIQHRIRMYDDLKAKYDAFAEAQERRAIKITLRDGRQMDGVSWETTPLKVAKLISTGLADQLVIAKVDGELFDLERPLERDCALELLDFDNEEGRQVFWHSSAHVLGEACERHYGCHLCLGPPVEEGFYYEMGMKDGAVSQQDYGQLNALARSIIKEKQPFERLAVSKADLLEMFRDNPYKLRLISDKIPDGTSSTVYRCGPLIDLCRGPHIPHTGRIKAFEVVKNSSSYFLGDPANDSLQRIYGISFPVPAMMKEYLKFKEEADRRDHRRVGREQQLYFFHELSPGSCFFLPHGARIYNKLLEFVRSEYRKRGFAEVITPNLFNANLWKTSGHWDNYKENMFAFECEKETFALKPMNCPGHCLLFAHRERSYRELPIRFADFGVLHRNELSGTLGGLTRVRRFQQDDAHIFCRSDQLGEEMGSCLSFMNDVYSVFGFTFDLKLSTRPEKYLGELAVWEQAEAQLTRALDAFGHPWQLNPGDGAFYGPKIDITIMDAHKRRHQCATIQIDYQLPIRFGLEFRGEADLGRPVIIHRAILGSLERMIAVLTENFAGNWPFWLSPRQAVVIPVSHANDEYATSVARAMWDAGFYAEADLSDVTLNKKIRNAEVSHHTFICVVGVKEQEEGTVSVRKASQQGLDVVLPADALLARFRELSESKARANHL